ncbi:hypothetical protein scyTo_0004001 [Scyliorhinus torazame]|uniref:Uncharacterized protein n=1 Tax=Scyliorhinus torazame TaxID=75743 RepID=A0A401NIU2_SCYTO|nr:hypothetical protein [Scyliorhinus torazame]
MEGGTARPAAGSGATQLPQEGERGENTSPAMHRAESPGFRGGGGEGDSEAVYWCIALERLQQPLTEKPLPASDRVPLYALLQLSASTMDHSGQTKETFPSFARKVIYPPKNAYSRLVNQHRGGRFRAYLNQFAQQINYRDQNDESEITPGTDLNLSEVEVTQPKDNGQNLGGNSKYSHSVDIHCPALFTNMSANILEEVGDADMTDMLDSWKGKQGLITRKQNKQRDINTSQDGDTESGNEVMFKETRSKQVHPKTHSGCHKEFAGLVKTATAGDSDHYSDSALPRHKQTFGNCIQDIDLERTESNVQITNEMESQINKKKRNRRKSKGKNDQSLGGTQYSGGVRIGDQVAALHDLECTMPEETNVNHAQMLDIVRAAPFVA